MGELLRNRRKAIVKMEQLLLALPATNYENTHLFGGGMYVRRMGIPKGHIVTGKVHVKEHICFLESGCVTVADDLEVNTYVAPCWLVGKAGVKRVFEAHEDSVWVAIHTTDSTSVEECENTLVHNDYVKFLNQEGD